MKKILFLCSLAVSLVFLSACKYAHGDGPDVASPKRHRKAAEPQKNPRKSNWLTENLNRERVGRKSVDKPANDDFNVFPHRSGRRSEKLKSNGSPFFWK